MRPAFLFIARNLGIKGSKLAIFRENSSATDGNVTIDKGSIAANVELVPRRGLQQGESGGTFYHLPGCSNSTDCEKLPVDERLRPKHNTYVRTDCTAAGGTRDDDDSLSGDEMALHGITVHQNVTQVSQGTI